MQNRLKSYFRTPYVLNLLSVLVGVAAKIKGPKFIMQPIYRWFIGRYGVNLSEAEKPLSEYKNFNQFFTRNLKPGVRRLPSRTDGLLVSPVDGRLREYGDLVAGARTEIKGIGYSFQELIGDTQDLFDCKRVVYANLYLAPGDYHHIHAPCDGEIVMRRHIPGVLWPVNDWALGKIPRLFVQNERVVLVGNSAFGRFCIVMVGAAIVGSVRVSIEPEFTTNSIVRRTDSTRIYPHPVLMKTGDRIGSFELGSSVLVLFEHTSKSAPLQWQVSAGSKVKYGEPIASLSVS